MNPTFLIRESIIKALLPYIKALQEAYKTKGQAAFIRVEGGMDRQLFTSQHPAAFHLSNATPEELIDRLFCPDELKNQLREAYARLTPGTCLIVRDSDSSYLESRITDWFICSV